jgi:hypothetical protein
MPTSIYERFGASVSFSEGDPGLFMVIGHAGDPTKLVESHGGSIALRINGGRILIARMTLPRALALQKERAIRLVGGVHLDISRYQALLRSLGVSNGPTPPIGP